MTPPRSGRPAPRQSARDAAVLAAVLDALLARHEPGAASEGSSALPAGDDASDAELGEGIAPEALAGVEDLIAAAVTELGRVPGVSPRWTASAPVLGAGVLQGILARRRRAASEPAPAERGDAPHVDERL